MEKTPQKKSYYAIIPANVRYCNKLSYAARLLYGEITALCNERGFCWASNKYLADEYETSIRNIQRWIENLRDAKFIKVEIIGMKRKIWIMSQDIVPIGADGEEIIPKKKKEPKESKSKMALDLCRWFDHLVKEKIKIEPVKNDKGYFAVVRAMNKGGLSKYDIVELFDEWFDLDNTEERKASIMAALSDFNINSFKIRKGNK